VIRIQLTDSRVSTALAVLVFLTTLELCIRVEEFVRWRAPLFGDYSHSALFVSDSLGWHPMPGASYQKWSINAHGFRGPPIDLVPPASTLRIVVLGASETFGQAESLGMEFPRVLERLLNSEQAGTFGGSRVEVLNAGIPGMTVPSMQRYWEAYVQQFSPDVVVIYPSPSFYLDDPPPSTPSSAVSVAAMPRRDAPRLIPKSREAFKSFLPAEIQALLKRILIDRTVSAHEPNWQWATAPRERVALYKAHLANLTTSVLATVPHIVYATHARAIASPDDMSTLVIGWQKFHPRASAQALFEFEDMANVVVADLAGVAGVFVAPVGRAVSASPQFFSDHQHFTDLGAQAVAETIASAVLTLPLQGRE
jgi:hypothetical protein